MVHTGNIIKKLRKERGWTQEELGQMLGVKKAAVQKYENGDIINLKIDTIRKLCNIFQISSQELIFPEAKEFDLKYDVNKLKEETRVLESIKNIYGPHFVTLLMYYDKLNDLGQAKILEDIQDMAELSKYTS